MPACTACGASASGLEGDEEGDAEQREEDGHASEDGELLLAHGRARDEGLHDELHTTKQTVAGGGGAKAKVTAPVNTGWLVLVLVGAGAGAGVMEVLVVLVVLALVLVLVLVRCWHSLGSTGCMPS